jgi:protein-S-isoprenylcysteine O-methyltransferase Ste14
VIDSAEHIVRIAAVAGLLTAWVVSGTEAFRSRQRPAGRGVGLAPRLGALASYLLAAIPYFTVWIVLWDPIPGTPSGPARVTALFVGAVLGSAGLTLYTWGRLTLGRMYNVSSAFGTELYADHRLIRDGPFRYVRHPMYVGIGLAAIGGLLVFRTWTMVFAVASVPTLGIKARHEDRLLAAQFGKDWHEYADRVPAFWPHHRALGRGSRLSKEVAHHD